MPYTVLETTIVPWLVQNEKALEQAGFHTLMRAFKSFDTENKGWIDANTLKTALTTKVLTCRLGSWLAVLHTLLHLCRRVFVRTCIK